MLRAAVAVEAGDMARPDQAVRLLRRGIVGQPPPRPPSSIELAEPSHSITSSARASRRDLGLLARAPLAVLRLITSSYLVGP